MLVMDSDAVYRDVNDAALRAMQRTRDEVIGQPLGFTTPDERHPELARMWETFKRQGHIVVGWELELPDGSPLQVDVVGTSGTPVPGSYLTVYVARPRAGGRLSPREREVTALLAQGYSGEQIAGRLFLSPETVRTHIRNAMQHIGAQTRAQLVAVALADGLITLDGETAVSSDGA
jgi:DNA-binding CsgD family transcriptional regulator